MASFRGFLLLIFVFLLRAGWAHSLRERTAEQPGYSAYPGESSLVEAITVTFPSSEEYHFEKRGNSYSQNDSSNVEEDKVGLPENSALPEISSTPSPSLLAHQYGIYRNQPHPCNQGRRVSPTQKSMYPRRENRSKRSASKLHRPSRRRAAASTVAQKVLLSEDVEASPVAKEVDQTDGAIASNAVVIGSSAEPSLEPFSSPISGAALAEEIVAAHSPVEPEYSTVIMPSKEPNASPSPSSSSSVSPSPSLMASPSAKGACFPGRAVVSLQGGRVKRMDEVELGDKVLVGKDTYSSVFMFTHRTDNIVASFVRLRTAAGPELNLTSSHYIYVNGRMAAASTVRIGDRVILGNGSDTTIVRTEIVSGTGLFNPQTIQGDIVVNGILSTTYTRAVQPAAAHALLVPLRFLYDFFGLLTKFAEQGLVE